MEKKRILIVDDSDEIRNLLQDFLSERYEVASCNGYKEAIRILEHNHFDIILTDLEMDYSLAGLMLAERVKSNQKKAKVILMSGSERPEIKKGKNKYDFFLKKPFDLSDLSRLLL